MPLNQITEENHKDFRVQARGEDSDGKGVFVSVELEAVDDFQWPACWRAASEMYDEGKAIEEDHGLAIYVQTTDVQSSNA